MAAAFRPFRAVALRCAKAVSTPKYNQNAKLQACRYLSCTTPTLSDRKYTEKHEWVSVEGNIGKVGITDYAQGALGDVVYAQLPDEGSEYEQDDECGALESVKAASEIYCPVSGTVTEKNAAVEETPGTINTSCYDDGWLFKIELSKPEEMESLMDEGSYDEFLKSQE